MNPRFCTSVLAAEPKQPHDQLVSGLLKADSPHTRAWLLRHQYLGAGRDDERLHASSSVVALLFAEARVDDVDDAVDG